MNLDPRTAHLAKFVDREAMEALFNDEQMEADRRELDEINRRWARAAFKSMVRSLGRG